MNVLYKEATFAVEEIRVDNQQILNVQFDLPTAERFTVWMLALAEGLASKLVLRSDKVKISICVADRKAEEAIVVKGQEMSLFLDKDKVAYCAWSFLKMVASNNAFPDHVDLDIVNQSGGEDTVTFKINR
jgi:hypothetical protein